ncbi:hypothetical protein [Streptomyces sp. VB1]|uniref:hypothetical protein n=1 Tax=Streptomyces sp. VB1 TaxID=2986803 RepID=UPI002241E0D1|nr:hypothetical protein [Streptomyces sp. VB1]UZI29698.1 hypothetical protein OH133_17055 [Streptomyces sp. VB1]
MSDPRDPLRSLFREAGEFGRTRSDADDASSITQRGMRAQRRRMALVAVGVCLVVGGGGAVAVGLLPVRPQPVLPATDPSPSYPSPVPSDPLRTQPPSLPPTPATTLPEGRSTGPGRAPTSTGTGTGTGTGTSTGRETTASTTRLSPTSTPSATTDGTTSMP